MPSPRGGSSFLLSLRWLCGSPSNWGRLGWGLLVGWGFSLAFPLLFIESVRVMKLIQKAVVADGGFALVVMSVPTVGKRVFLRVDAAIPTVMRGMTPSAATVKKAAFGRSKSPAFAGRKTAAYWRPLSKPFPMGWGFYAVLGANFGNSYRGR